MKGIDVSYANGAIAWDAVKNDGIEFAIIRAGYGRAVWQKDRQFERNYSEGTRVGMPLGVYWYSYAESVEDARVEAETFLEIVGDKKFPFGLWYDIEEPSILGRGKDFVSECINVFCSTLEKAGMFAGFYTSKSVAENLVHKEIADRYACWSAQWNTTDDYKGQHGIWQYSDRGRVVGIVGNVDLDISYIDYPKIIVAGGFNGYPKSVDATVEKPVETVETVETVEKPVEKSDVETYTIVSGDTLSGIAKKYRTTVKKLMQLNSDKITDPDVIYAGDVILVPGGRLK